MEIQAPTAFLSRQLDTIEKTQHVETGRLRTTAFDWSVTILGSLVVLVIVAFLLVYTIAYEGVRWLNALVRIGPWPSVPADDDDLI